MSTILDKFAARVSDDPLFLAGALAEYARSEKLDDAGLAAALGLPLGDLARLRISGRPRAESFRADVTAIAARFGIDADRLAEVVLLGQALAELRADTSAVQDAGLLLAARDADPPTEPNS